MKKYAIILGFSFILGSCMSSRTYYGDDVYVLKPNDLPVGESSTDQTSYSSFKNRTREGRVSTVYYAVPNNYLGMDCYNTLFWNTGCRYAFGYSPFWGYNTFSPYYMPHNMYYAYDPLFNPYFNYGYNPYGYYGYNNFYGYPVSQNISSGTRIYGPRTSSGGYANPRAVDIANGKSEILVREGKNFKGMSEPKSVYRTQNTMTETTTNGFSSKPNTTYTPTDKSRVSNRTHSVGNGELNSTPRGGRPVNSGNIDAKPRSSGDFKDSNTSTPTRNNGSTGRSGSTNQSTGGRRP